MTQWPIKKTCPGTPLYKVVENFLQEQITAGELAPGDLIPSEPQLAEAPFSQHSAPSERLIENLVHQNMTVPSSG